MGARERMPPSGLTVFTQARECSFLSERASSLTQEGPLSVAGFIIAATAWCSQ